MLPSACQVIRSIDSLMKWTDPSPAIRPAVLAPEALLVAVSLVLDSPKRQ